MSTTALEQSFADICVKHGVHSVGVTFHKGDENQRSFWSISLQTWVDHSPSDRTALEHGDTIAEALTKAIEKLGPAASFAEQALPMGEAA